MADETRKVLLELNIDTVKSIKNIKELKDLQKAANAELDKAKIGTETYKKLETASGLLTKRITGLKDATKQNTKELDVQKGSARDLSAQYTALTRALREAAPGQNVLGLSFDEAKKKAHGLKEEIKGFEEQLGNTAPNVGNYGSAFKDAAGGINVFGTSLGNVFQMILTNPVGLIIAALVGLFNILKQNDTIATFFTGVMTGLGVVIDQVSAVISGLVLGLGQFGGEASKVGIIIKDVGTRILNNLLAPINYLIDLMPAVNAALAGEFKKAASIAGDASVQFGKSIVFLNNEVPKFVTNMSDAVKVGIAYEKALDDIEAKQSKLNVTTKQLENQRDRLKLQAEDLLKSDQERDALREKAIAIDKKVLSQRLALLDEEIAAQQKYADALGKDSVKKEAAEFRLNDLAVKRLEFENESLKFEEKIQNKRNAMIEKQLAAEAKLSEEQEKARLKRIEDEAKLAEKIIQSDNKLHQFKLDLAAKNATSIDERLRKELASEDFRVKVLLSNENLLASEKAFIQADSAAKISDIVKKSEEAQRLESKKTADERKANSEKSTSAVLAGETALAGAANNINQVKLNTQTAALEAQRERELKSAGTSAKKREKINAEYDKKKLKLEKASAERSKAISITQAIINTAVSVSKALASAPPPANFFLAAANAIAGAAEVAVIASSKFGMGGLVKKFASGGLPKSGIIGGKPHSAGGTKFYGDDGSMFEAEQGELMAIVNKRDTPLLSMLSNVNSIHGKAFYGEGGMRSSSYMNDGGFAARASSQPVIDTVMQRNDIMNFIASMPPSIVTIEDINAGVGTRTRVVSRANI